MTIHRLLNQAGLGGNYATWYLWNEMLNAGWVVLASGSGTGGIYDTADVFDHAINPVVGALATVIGVGSGDESWGGATCWIILTGPDGSQLAIQRDNAAGSARDDDWAYAYSPGGNFALGSANANTAGVAPDQENLYGTLNSNWLNIHAVGGTANLIHVAVDDALSPAGMSGLCMLEVVAGPSISAGVFMDDLRSVPVGSALEAHAKTVKAASSGPLTKVALDAGSMKGFFGYGEYATSAEQAEAFDSALYFTPRNNVVTLYPGNAAAPVSGEVPVPIPVGSYYRGGFCGLSRWFLWQAEDRDYNDYSTDKTLWYVDDVMVQDLPDGVTIPVVV
jgi:hypothetical protein